MGSAILQLIITLAIVILFCYLAYIITRMVARGNFMGVRGRHIRIIERLPVSKDSSILLLRAVDKVLVVGVTQAGMTTLRELPADAVSEEQAEASPITFSEAFRSALRDSMPTATLRSKVGEWLHVKKESDHANHR